jgi:hypothetical protein
MPSNKPRQFTHDGNTWVCVETQPGLWEAQWEGNLLRAGTFKSLKDRIKLEKDIQALTPEEKKAKEQQWIRNDLNSRMQEAMSKPITGSQYFRDMFGDPENRKPGLVPSMQTHESLLTYLVEMGNQVEKEVAITKAELAAQPDIPPGALSALNRLLDLIQWSVMSDQRLSAWAEAKRIQQAEKEKARIKAETEAAIADPGVSDGQRNAVEEIPEVVADNPLLEVQQ